MEELKKIYGEYVQRSGQPQYQRKPFQGAYGLFGGAQPDSFHQRFVQDVEQALAQVGEEHQLEAVKYIFQQPLRHKKDPAMYGMFRAVHGVTLPYLKALSMEQARDLQWWYENAYPRQERMPCQERVVAALERMRRRHGNTENHI